MTFSQKKFPVLFCALLFGISVVSCNSGSTSSEEMTSDSTTTAPADDQQKLPTAVAVISPSYSDTAVDGRATFTTENDGKVKLQLTLHIPAKADKEVAVHIHEHGDCGEMGKNAHGHWNPTDDLHGKWGSEHFHRGDIGNVKLDKDGNGTLEMTTDLWSVGGNDSTKNILNRALIVHGGFDDYKSQPTGNAGNRIGCGVIQ